VNNPHFMLFRQVNYSAHDFDLTIEGVAIDRLDEPCSSPLSWPGGSGFSADSPSSWTGPRASPNTFSLTGTCGE
jgi:hypothetical protein